MTQHILKAHNYAQYDLYHWCFSKNFLKIFRIAILKENILMDVPYFNKEHLWISASDKAVNPPQSWPWKQNGIAVVAAAMILEVMNNWRSVLQINILKKSWTLNSNHLTLQEMYAGITTLAWLVSTWHICLTEIPEERHLILSDYLNQPSGT